MKTMKMILTCALAISFTGCTSAEILNLIQDVGPLIDLLLGILG